MCFALPFSFDLSREPEFTPVIPAKAGIQLPLHTDRDRLSTELALGNSPSTFDPGFSQSAIENPKSWESAIGSQD